MPTWSGVRVVYGADLESLCMSKYREFESLPLRVFYFL